MQRLLGKILVSIVALPRCHLKDELKVLSWHHIADETIRFLFKVGIFIFDFPQISQIGKTVYKADI